MKSTWALMIWFFLEIKARSGFNNCFCFIYFNQVFVKLAWMLEYLVGKCGGDF